jgi:hypothetical protein
MGEYPFIMIAIWGLIQAGLVYSVDREPGPTVLWFLIFVAVCGAWFASIHLKVKIRRWIEIWMYRTFVHAPLYQRWMLWRHERMKLRMKLRKTNPLHGVYLVLVPGSLFGPIFGIGLSQLFRPQTPGFRAASVGMLVGIACFEVLFVIMIAIRNLFVRRGTYDRHLKEMVHRRVAENAEKATKKSNHG